MTQVLGINRPESVIVDLIAEIDRDGNGVLDFAEYCLMMMSLPRRLVCDVITDSLTNAAISHLTLTLCLCLSLSAFLCLCALLSAAILAWCAC